MKRSRFRIRIGLWVSSLLVSGTVARAQGNEKDHSSWWITNYGLLDTSKEPLAARAQIIFERLAATADKRANRLPRLAILDADGNPFAMALPDGSILLTRGALRICYTDVLEEVGDARLGFVIGHELAHLSNDDFWHAAAFDAIRHLENSEEARGTLETILRQPVEDAAKRELQADAYGMLYMVAAGYDPKAILRRKSFFDKWSDELDKLGLRPAGAHANPAERAAFLGTQLAAIADEMNFFRFGVRLVQFGRYRDGLLLLERFRDRFPSREVLNNIGVAHYQLAARFLGNCDGQLVTRFKLPTVLDSATRAVRLRGSEKSGCFQSERFRLHYREAERNLAEATEMDPSYTPARLNLLSLYALSQEGAQALVASEEIKELDVDDPRVLSGAAVAVYLYGEQSGLELADTALQQLQELCRAHPESSDAAYNLASILAERRRVQAAEEAFRAFLALERRGVYAEAAADYLGQPIGDPVGNADGVRSRPKSPLPLGPLNRPELLERFPDARIEDFVIGDFNGSFVSFTGGSALAIDETVELVEESITSTRSNRAEQYGPPKSHEVTSAGELLLYDGFAVEIRDGIVNSRFYY